jgi:cell division protein FtsZ
MGEMGKAMMGTGEAEGPDRSRVAAESAISNPLLEDHSMKGAKGVLINITGGLDMTLHEVDEAANRIREEVDADANIIFGSTFDASMQGRMRVSVVATGIAALAQQAPAPNYLNLDMTRPIQTGQPALSRPVAPVGRVAMPAAAVAAPVPTPAPVIPAAPIAVPVAPPPAPMPAPAPVMMEAPAPVVAEAPPPIAAPPVEAPVAVAPAPEPVPVAAIAPAPAPVAAPAPAPVPQKPLVDENDWRVTRPAGRPVVRASEPIARPTAARVAGGERSPNLFQRITGAFAAPKAPAAAAPVVEPPVRAPQPENVVAVAPKPAVRPAPAQPSMSLDVTERAKPARDDDDLQIPAFLRRQAN